MVAPVDLAYQGYFVNVASYNHNERQFRRSFKQRPPYDLRLPWTRFGIITDHTDNTVDPNMKTIWASLAESALPPSTGTPYFRVVAAGLTDSYNTAFSRLVSALRQGNSANLGVSLYEGRESLEMIHNRLSSFVKAFRFLRKGDLASALSALAIRPRPGSLPKRRKNQSSDSWLQTVASNFLEYKFGWAPLCSDIWEAYAVLSSNPVRPVNFSVGSKRDVVENTSYGGFPASFKGTVGVRLACTAVLSNPNVALANQLGLVNPLSVAWEVTTLSFLFDWFANVKKVLNSFTDLLGFTVSNCSVTRFITGGAENHLRVGVKVSDKLRRAQRETVSGFENIKFRMKLPLSSDPSLLGKAISLAALAVQNLSLFKSKGI